MPQDRIAGQDVEVRLVVGGKVQSTVTDVRSFEMTDRLEMKDEGYLGEKANRKDDFYLGAKFRMGLHSSNKDVHTLVGSIRDRARDRTAGVKVNITATLNYPNGDQVRVMFQDAAFSDIPFSFGGRTDYGEVTLEGECTSATVLAS